MPGSCEIELQEALVTALKADVPLTALISSRVYDWVPDDATYPLVTVGDIVTQPKDTTSEEGSDCLVTLHTWAKGPGARVSARRIGQALNDLLHRNSDALAIAGHDTLLIKREFGDVFSGGSGGAQVTSMVAHGVYRFMVRTCEQ